MKGGAGGERRSVDLVVSLAALALGAPGCAGLALGIPLADWPVPLHPQLSGEIALKTVVYLSGFLASYGAIGLVWLVWGAGDGSDGDGRFAAPPFSRSRREGAASGDDAADGTNKDPGPEGHVSLVEPLYGFLPADEQRRLARETGYQPLLFTKISALMSAAVGVLLAGSWDIVSVSEPIPPDAALQIGAGLYLMAESFRRYRCFARGEPSGTLIGALVHGALRPLRGKGGGP